MNECPMCNTHNPPQAVTCRTCKLSLPRSNASSIFHTGDRPKMAVFDLDKTLFDLSRRERAAKRQGLKPGSKKWFEVINQNNYILMDTPIKGTVKFVNQLSENGFTIAYLSGRPRAALAATKQSLQESGFPIDADEQDLVFLHSGRGSIPNITNHKKSVLTHLKNKFDVDFFFDDTPEFREAAKSLFIPGVYPSIAAYTEKEERPKKARKNPNHGEDLCPSTTAIDPYTGVYYACSKPAGHEGPHDFSIEMVFPDIDPDADNPFDNPNHGGGVTTNPAPKPRKKRAKNGSMRKEPMDKYLDRFMGDKKMNEEFPDRSQRFAVGLSYARKFYGDAAVDKKYPPRENPAVTTEYGQGGVVVLDENLQYMTYTGKTVLPRGVSYQLIKKLRSLLSRDREHKGFVKDNKIYYGTSFGTHGVSWRPTDALDDAVFTFHTHPYGFTKSMKGVISTADLMGNLYLRLNNGVQWELIVQKRGINFVHTSIKKGSPLAKKMSTWKRAKTKETKRKLAKEMWSLFDTDEKAIRNLYRGDSSRYFSEMLGNGPPNWEGFSELGYEVAMLKTANKFMKNFEFNMYYLEVPSIHADWTKEVTESYPLDKMEFQDIAGYLKGYKQIKSNPVRANPANVGEAKKMYQQFHKKQPKSVKKKQIDFGDTWVGLGKAWSIGYRSGKETGDESQKYIHNFGVDEESGKKFAEPELYYVKNKDGSQMMVIMGGDWYIDVDEAGEVSWIYI